jgi:S-(hydroxymethyl)glutathione dehydrogenase/alcohol dehydrogenase
MEARAAISDGNGDFAIDTIEVDEPRENEVRVAMKAAGVCHTDYQLLTVYKQPRVMGHEGAGVVESIGPGVTHVRPGDRALLNWATPCGECHQCKLGSPALCENRRTVPDERVRWRGKPIARSFRIGTMSTLMVVPKQAVSKIEIDIPFTAASIIGCGVMTGFGSVVNVAKVTPGASVVVIGTGGVGLNCIQGARIAGASQIIAVDINANRLEMARRFGATHTIQSRSDDTNLLVTASEVRELTRGRGADFAFEATAVPELAAAPLAMVRNGGVAVQVSGVEQEISIDMNLFEWNKSYINPLYGGCRPEIDFPILLDLYQQGTLLLEELVTRTYRLAELEEAFSDMYAGLSAKGVLVLDA